MVVIEIAVAPDRSCRSGARKDAHVTRGYDSPASHADADANASADEPYAFTG
ncbi:hypothetical protein [Burkholderia ubonensis]|uniref:hypothetical protein n=1 Tax=Burkholderia ubonensis TaxID=101571 RepID=UPI0015821F61|nr:hypothetical protein [Burkholderia ubonensis]